MEACKSDHEEKNVWCEGFRTVGVKEEPRLGQKNTRGEFVSSFGLNKSCNASMIVSVILELQNFTCLTRSDMRKNLFMT